MDLETLINIVLIAVFLLITFFVRILKSKTKKKPGIQKKQSRNPLFSFVQKIRDQIQESLQELERQARQQQTGNDDADDPGFWDELAEEGLTKQKSSAPMEQDTLSSETSAKGTPRQQPDTIEASEKASQKQEEVPPPTIHPYGRRPSLRQAVIWSEIIGKPVALRKNQSDSVI
ncbi:MAG: hypothetical protein ABR534_07705 [Desulfotignum sp.]